jgi:hypothetical protein
VNTDLVTLADTPAAIGDGLPTIKIPVAKLGTYRDKRYGSFSIGDADYESWQRNLTEGFGGRALVDFDHSPEKGTGTRAAGWITSLEKVTGAQLQEQDPARFAKLDPQAVYVASDVELSKAGAEALRNREYRYISPTFVANWTDETGAKRGRTLLGAGLTNRPFLRRGMPAISLSADDYEAAAVEQPPASDSRPRMPLTADIAKKLGLSEDTDDAVILEAANAAGVVVLTAAEVADFESRAAAGDQATKTLAETRFSTAWTKAVDEVRVTPAQETDFKALAEKDLDLAVKTLDGLQPLKIATSPRGTGDAPPAATAEDGVDAVRLELHEAALTLSEEKGIPYMDAVHKLEEAGR